MKIHQNINPYDVLSGNGSNVSGTNLIMTKNQRGRLEKDREQVVDFVVLPPPLATLEDISRSL